MGWGMVVRGVLSPLSGLISEIDNSVGLQQRNFTFVRRKSGKIQGISETSGSGNHDCFCCLFIMFSPNLVSCSGSLQAAPEFYNG